jgi:hypothetical protein
MRLRASVMRTTLVIDDDVLTAAKAIARQRQQTIGQVVSELARSSLHPVVDPADDEDDIPSLPVRNPKAVVTMEIVNALRDELP